LNKENKYYLLLHPLAISALILLLLNDHFLKIFSPGFITGKLSDFAGLFVFPIYLSVITRDFLRNRFRVEMIIFFSAILFIALQIESLLNIILLFADKISFPRPNLVADYTDLIALTMLPLSYQFIKNNEQKTRLIYRKYIYSLFLIIYTFAVTATSFVYYSTILPDEYFGEAEDTAKVLFIFEQSLNEQSHEIIYRNKVDEKYTYIVRFNLDLLKSEKLEYDIRYLITEIEFEISNQKDSIVLRKIELMSNDPEIKRKIDTDEFGELIIKKYFLLPFRSKLYENE